MVFYGDKCYVDKAHDKHPSPCDHNFTLYIIKIYDYNFVFSLA